MGGYHAVGTAPTKLLEHGLGYGSAYLGLGAGAELVDEQQRGAVGVAHHLLHVRQVARVRAEVVLYALLVAYVDEYVAEHARMRAFAHRYGQAALQHVLHEAHRLEAYRLAAGVGTGYDEYAPCLRQRYVERHHALALLAEREFQQRVGGLYPVNVGIRLNVGLDSVDKPCERGLGVDKVDGGKETV